MTFRDYLKHQHFSSSTITNYEAYFQGFVNWHNTKYPDDTQALTYKNALGYIAHLKQRNCQPQTINLRLTALKKYGEYLIFTDQIVSNPLEDLRLKGVIKKQVLKHLDADALELLYHGYPKDHFKPHTNGYSKLCSQRNKVLVGFMVFQGLNTTALKQLEIEHLDLSKGRVYIAETKRSNSRYMALNSSQITDLMYYLERVHSILQPKGYESFIFSSKALNHSISKAVLPTLKKMNPLVCSASFIRASVIVAWLGKYPIRKVQYLAGHRYISSTQNYRQDDLKSLQQAIEDLHPLR